MVTSVKPCATAPVKRLFQACAALNDCSVNWPALCNISVLVQANFEVPLVLAGLLALAIEGVLMYALFVVIEKR